MYFLSQVYKRSICPWGIFLFNVWWLMWEDPVYCGWCDSLAIYSWVSFGVPALVFPSYGLWHRRISQIFYPLTHWLWSLFFFFYHSNSNQRQINLGFLEDCDKYINQAFCLFFSSISLLLFQFPPSFHFHIFSSPSFPIYYCIYIPEPLTYQDKMFI